MKNAISQTDLDALLYAGIMRHAFFVVRTFADGSTGTVAFLNCPFEADRFAKPGDRLYRCRSKSRRDGTRYELVKTFGESA